MLLIDLFLLVRFCEKLFVKGVKVFLDVELLVIFLCIGVLGMNVIEFVEYLFSINSIL